MDMEIRTSIGQLLRQIRHQLGYTTSRREFVDDFKFNFGEHTWRYLEEGRTRFQNKHLTELLERGIIEEDSIEYRNLENMLDKLNKVIAENKKTKETQKPDAFHPGGVIELAEYQAIYDTRFQKLVSTEGWEFSLASADTPSRIINAKNEKLKWYIKELGKLSRETVDIVEDLRGELKNMDWPVIDLVNYNLHEVYRFSVREFIYLRHIIQKLADEIYDLKQLQPPLPVAKKFRELEGYKEVMRSKDDQLLFGVDKPKE